MIEIGDMTTSDLCEAIKLWDSIAELKFSVVFDNKERLSKFLIKNEGLSSIAKSENKIVGALLCGNDGRRGFFYHIGVSPQFRKQRIASRMVEHSIEKLKKDGIDTCFLFTNDFNTGAQAFWNAMGFEYASHVMYHSKLI